MMRPLRFASTAFTLAKGIVTQQDKRSLSRQLAQEIQHLGPLYIKAGQFVSSRKDIFGAEVTEELAVLRDGVVPISPDVVKQIIDSAGLADRLSSIDYQPIASASVGQVHMARVKGPGGRRVVIKIKRPDIKQELLGQLAVLKLALDAAEAMRLRVDSVHETRKLLQDFERAILDEVDFAQERMNIRRFCRIYAKANRVVVPNVYEDMCSEDLIIMDYVETVDVAHFKGNRQRLARELMELFVDQLLYTGVMHGDPHSGNIRITPTGEIVMLDFGNILVLSSTERHQLKELVCQLVIGNVDAVLVTMRKLGIKIDDPKAARVYVGKYMEYMRTIDINTFKTSGLAADGAIPIRVSNTIVRIVRVFGTLEGTCKELDPNFNYFDLLETYVDSVLIDDEFLMYKISADTNTLLSNAMRLVGPPAEDAPDAQPAAVADVEPSARWKDAFMLLAALQFLSHW